MRFDSIVFVHDHQMTVYNRKWHKPDHISLEGLPTMPQLPSYHFIEENCKDGDRILEEIKPYVKGFLIKPSLALYVPDDATTFCEQRYLRNYFIRHNASTNTTVQTYDTLLKAVEKEYICISRSERMVTMTYRKGANEPIRTHIPLALANYQAIDTAIDNLGPEVAYNEPEIYIMDPDHNMKEYYPLGEVLELDDMVELAKKLAQQNGI